MERPLSNGFSILLSGLFFIGQFEALVQAASTMNQSDIRGLAHWPCDP
jgi:hypothetical protein